MQESTVLLYTKNIQITWLLGENIWKTGPRANTTWNKTKKYFEEYFISSSEQDISLMKSGNQKQKSSVQYIHGDKWETKKACVYCQKMYIQSIQTYSVIYIAVVHTTNINIKEYTFIRLLRRLIYVTCFMLFFKWFLRVNIIRFGNIPSWVYFEEYREWHCPIFHIKTFSTSESIPVLLKKQHLELHIPMFGNFVIEIIIGCYISVITLKRTSENTNYFAEFQWSFLADGASMS